MNKYEYVNCIEKSLVGKITTQELHDTVRYYNDYIDMEIRKGKTEEQVLDSLGDPRLIAKNIIVANSEKKKVGQSVGEEKEYESGQRGASDRKSFRIPWILVAVVLVLLVLLVFSVLFSIASVLLPIIIPIAIILFAISLFKK